MYIVIGLFKSASPSSQIIWIKISIITFADEYHKWMPVGCVTGCIRWAYAEAAAKARSIMSKSQLFTSLSYCRVKIYRLSQMVMLRFMRSEIGLKDPILTSPVSCYTLI
jgi:hypothetical protein